MLLAEEQKLDGCYVIKTDLTTQQADKQTVHDRYRDVSQIEMAFRTSKTVLLEMRPVYVQLADRTRGHALVVMLAYRLVQELARLWQSADLTVEEGLKQLSTLCVTNLQINGQARCGLLPKPRPTLAHLLELADVKLPAALRSRGIEVATRKKLPSNRKNR